MPFNPTEFLIDEELSKNHVFESMGRRIEGLQRGSEIIEKLRQPFAESLRQRVERSAEAGEALAQLRHQIEESGKRLEAFSNGKMTRAELVQAGRPGWLEALGPKAKEVFKRVYDDVGTRPPLIPDEALAALFGQKELRGDWSARHTGNDFTFYEPIPDVGVRRDALGDPEPPPMSPPSIDRCFTATFDKQETISSAQMLTFPIAISTPASRRFFTDCQSIGTAFPSWGWARATVGTDIVVPPGFTTLQVTADIDFSGSFASGALFATGAVASGDLIVKLTHSNGSSAETLSSVGVQVAAVLSWGTTAASGNRIVSCVMNVPSTGGVARLLAGAQSVSTAAVGVSLWAVSSLSGTVRSICVVAT